MLSCNSCTAFTGGEVACLLTATAHFDHRKVVCDIVYECLWGKGKATYQFPYQGCSFHLFSTQFVATYEQEPLV